MGHRVPLRGVAWSAYGRGTGIGCALAGLGYGPETVGPGTDHLRDRWAGPLRASIAESGDGWVWSDE